MNEYQLKNITWLTRDSILLTLEPLAGTFMPSFFPGQYIALGFKKNSRPSPVRCFSIVSSPNEKTLQVGMRVAGTFTKTISNLNPGDSLFAFGPFGNFVVDEEVDKNIVLFAGGIGITPFMSIIKYLTEEAIKIPITLVYGIRDTENIPFYQELLELERRNKFLRIYFTVAGDIGANFSPNKFFKGYITDKLVENITKNNYQPYTYFICGPKPFKDNLINILNSKNVAQNQIITEEFTPSTQLKSDAEDEAPKIPKYTYALSALTFMAGTAFFMAVDLIRFIPKVTNAQAAPTQSTTQTDDSSNSQTTDSTSTQPSQTQQNTYTQPAPTTYQQPTTRVS